MNTIIALIIQANPIIITPNNTGLSERLNKNSSKFIFDSVLSVIVVFSFCSSTSSGIIVTG